MHSRGLLLRSMNCSHERAAAAASDNGCFRRIAAPMREALIACGFCRRVRWFLGRRTRACAQEDKRGVGNASERYRDSGGLDLSRSSRPGLRFQCARACSRSCVLRRCGLGAAMEVSGPLALRRSASTHQLVRPVGAIRYPAVDDTAYGGRAPNAPKVTALSCNFSGAMARAFVVMFYRTGASEACPWKSLRCGLCNTGRLALPNTLCVYNRTDFSACTRLARSLLNSWLSTVSLTPKISA